MPKVSVIVPVYNTEQFIKKCVDSLLKQTLEDIEFILVDDGSLDNSAFICDEYARLDSRVKVIHKENGGLSSARNAALDICEGEYVGFVDSDDFVEPTMFEELYNSAVKNNSDISICALSKFYKGESVKKMLPFDKELYKGREILEYFLVPLLGDNSNEKVQGLEGFVCRQLFKKEIIGNIRFKSEREYFAEDVMFDFDIYPLCKTISVVNKPLYFYRYNGDSLSNRYRENVWDMLANYLDAEYALIDNLDIKNDASVKIRTDNLILKFVIFSILNLGKADCYLTKIQKKKELKKIRSNKYVKGLLKLSSIKHKSLKETIMLLLLKFKMFDIILIYLQVKK